MILNLSLFGGRGANSGAPVTMSDIKSQQKAISSAKSNFSKAERNFSKWQGAARMLPFDATAETRQEINTNLRKAGERLDAAYNSLQEAQKKLDKMTERYQRNVKKR